MITKIEWYKERSFQEEIEWLQSLTYEQKTKDMAFWLKRDSATSRDKAKRDQLIETLSKLSPRSSVRTDALRRQPNETN